MSASQHAEQIDEMMEHASRALIETRYFDAASLAGRALQRAHGLRDFERMARICMPLQEARRQVRQLAVDAGIRGVFSSGDELSGPVGPGCYLLQPPLLGIHGRSLRAAADRAKLPMFVLVREPLTRSGLWPIVGTATISVRVKVPPPGPLQRVENHVTKDAYAGAPPLTLAWFEAAGEALGDAAIAAVPASRHPWWRVEDLMEALEAVPEHEKLHQALAASCRAAAGVGPPPEVRRPMPTDPWSF